MLNLVIAFPGVLTWWQKMEFVTFISTDTIGDMNTLQNRKEMFTDTNIPT